MAVIGLKMIDTQSLNDYVKYYTLVTECTNKIKQMNAPSKMIIYKYFLLKEFGLINDVNTLIIKWFPLRYTRYFNTQSLDYKLNFYRQIDLLSNLKGELGRMKSEMVKEFNVYFNTVYNMTVTQIIKKVIKRLSNTTMCYDDYGYYVNGIKDRWRVKPEYYQQVKILNYERIALDIGGFRYIYIDEKASRCGSRGN